MVRKSRLSAQDQELAFEGFQIARASIVGGTSPALPDRADALRRRLGRCRHLHIYVAICSFCATSAGAALVVKALFDMRGLTPALGLGAIGELQLLQMPVVFPICLASVLANAFAISPWPGIFFGKLRWAMQARAGVILTCAIQLVFSYCFFLAGLLLQLLSNVCEAGASTDAQSFFAKLAGQGLIGNFMAAIDTKSYCSRVGQLDVGSLSQQLVLASAVAAWSQMPMLVCLTRVMFEAKLPHASKEDEEADGEHEAAASEGKFPETLATSDGTETNAELSGGQEGSVASKRLRKTLLTNDAATWGKGKMRIDEKDEPDGASHVAIDIHPVVDAVTDSEHENTSLTRAAIHAIVTEQMEAGPSSASTTASERSRPQRPKLSLDKIVEPPNTPGASSSTTPPKQYTALLSPPRSPYDSPESTAPSSQPLVPGSGSHLVREQPTGQRARNAVARGSRSQHDSSEVPSGRSHRSVRERPANQKARDVSARGSRSQHDSLGVASGRSHRRVRERPAEQEADARDVSARGSTSQHDSLEVPSGRSHRSGTAARNENDGHDHSGRRNSRSATEGRRDANSEAAEPILVEDVSSSRRHEKVERRRQPGEASSRSSMNVDEVSSSRHREEKSERRRQPSSRSARYVDEVSSSKHHEKSEQSGEASRRSSTNHDSSHGESRPHHRPHADALIGERDDPERRSSTRTKPKSSATGSHASHDRDPDRRSARSASHEDHLDRDRDRRGARGALQEGDRDRHRDRGKEHEETSVSRSERNDRDRDRASVRRASYSMKI